MGKRRQSIFAPIIPFIGAGVAIVFIVFALILVSYLLLWGALVGLVLFVIAYIKGRFFPSKTKVPTTKGRTYDHDE